MRRSCLWAGYLGAVLGTPALASKPDAFTPCQLQEIGCWRAVVQKKGLTPE